MFDASRNIFTICSKEKIPDPVDILNRIASIETSIQSLQKECSELNQQRHIAAKNTTSLVLKNYMAIKEVSIYGYTKLAVCIREKRRVNSINFINALLKYYFHIYII